MTPSLFHTAPVSSYFCRGDFRLDSKGFEGRLRRASTARVSFSAVSRTSS